MRIEVKGLGRCTTAEAMELDLLYPALQIILQRVYLNFSNYSFSMQADSPAARCPEQLSTFHYTS
jgi:hypothetical protein